MAKVSRSGIHSTIGSKHAKKMEEERLSSLHASSEWMNDFLNSFKDQKKLYTNLNLCIELMEEAGQQRCLFSEQRECEAPKRQEVFNFTGDNGDSLEQDFCASRKSFEFQQVAISDRREIVKDEDFAQLSAIVLCFEEFKIKCRTLFLTHLKPTQKMLDVFQPRSLISNGVAIEKFWSSVCETRNLREIVIGGDYDDHYLVDCGHLVQRANLKFSLVTRMMKSDTFTHICDLIKDCSKTRNTLEIECFIKVPAHLRRVVQRIRGIEEKLVYRNEQQWLAYYMLKSRAGVTCLRLAYNYTFLSIQAKFCRGPDQFQAFFDTFTTYKEVCTREEIQKKYF